MCSSIHTFVAPPQVLRATVGFDLHRGVVAAADVCLRIPIAPDVDSLNVGHAAAIAFATLR